MNKLILSVLILLLVPIPINAYFHHDSEIDWHDYGQKTFDKAKKEDKPVFMLVTAVWCYWCHVYRDETLHDHDVIEYINNNFIPVFVDADKRQDLTRQYLAGGWPSTIIFSPSGKEVASINGHIKKQDLLNYLARAARFFETNELPENYEEEELVIKNQITVPGKKDLVAFANNLPLIVIRNYDSEYGGFGTGQKFPQPIAWGLVLDAYEETGRQELLDAATKTLDSMYYDDFIDDWDKPLDLGEVNGRRNFDDERIFQGIYDPVEGGFFRYATRRDWSVPHYEKMLDSNSELIALYLHGYKITKNDEYKEIAVKSLEYVENNFYDSSLGGFGGSQDAGHEIYYRQRPEVRLSDKTHEKKPFIDKTKYSDFNGPAIVAFFEAYEILGDEKYLDIAVKSSDFFLEEMTSEDGIYHVYDENGASLRGLLLDNAHMIIAFSKAYEVTKEDKYRDAAIDLADFSFDKLYDKGSGAFIERNSPDKELYLNGEEIRWEIPYAGNSVMAQALASLYSITFDSKYLDAANTVVGYFIGNIGNFGTSSRQAMASLVIIENKQDLKDETEIIQTEERIALTTDLEINWFLFFIAFVVGLLSFFSPCTLPILPAYFAYAFGSERRKVLLNTLSFFLGLAVVFSVIGLTSTIIGGFLRENSFTISKYLGVVVILFGILTVFGKGFSGIRVKQNNSKTLIGSFLFGVTFAIGWTPCVGPILASLFILASQTGTAAAGATLLFIYAIGLALPLIIISLFFDKMNKNGKFWKFVKGREIKARIYDKDFRFHSTSLISGVLLILIGLLMFTGYLIIFNKLVGTWSFQEWIFGLEKKLVGLF